MSKKMRRDGNRTPIPLALITRLFQLVSERKFAEAERIFERINARMNEKEDDEFNSGYLQALKGIILSHRSGEASSDGFLGNLNLKDIDALKKYYREFRDNAENGLHGEYDRGYFSALSEYIRVILKTVQSRITDKSGG